ncbi:DEAD/DEAH box helicase [Rhizobium ruizarguesonis]|uniref:DEAD/DEAH box helicase n=1 Tax=Rhizobium ruizarguesonis TaxID=2081791 RepID=UPI0013EF34B9|nr:DEAD/DEAH box helicase [Rhizobium ruizarguesonis]
MSELLADFLDGSIRWQADQVVGRNLLADLPAVRAGDVGLDEWEFAFLTYQLDVFALLGSRDQESELRKAAEVAFEAARAAPVGDISLALETACYGILADRTPDVARYLRSFDLEPIDIAADWDARVRQTVSHVWILLLRKDGWQDLDAVNAHVLELRQLQATFERQFLETTENPRRAAWELIASYHLSKAAEILAIYTGQGSVDGSFDVREQLQSQFDRSLTACLRAELIDMHSLVSLLNDVSERMVRNSIWTVTRAVNSRVSRFVQNLVSRSRETPMFEMLPPQRITLRDNGLLGSGHRAVVVSLPTSSGKTLIAQFRMLQALNQFDSDRGWVAYIAPTRALVNQICARLRRDFAPLGIVVERLSPALEIDGVEAQLLSETEDANAFRVVVTTPEKLDMLLRGGWEAKIGRPLTLVVVDEAHNISGDERGLKLELLLATINREYRQSQFLLLTPFINNAGEIAKWLAPDSNADITVEFEWRPNDRAIAIAMPEKTDKPGDFLLKLTTVHTNKNTIQIEDEIPLSLGRPLGLKWSNVNNNLSNVAAATAVSLNHRGPVIVVAGKVADAWSIARTIHNDPELATRATKRDEVIGARSFEDIDFVADFVNREFGEDFALSALLRSRIGVHHSGLSDEAKVLMEWLVEREQIDTLVATTTIAQGVNFPVTGVVMAAHQYPYGKTMPPEDFWNLAGRAARADQAGTGIIALAATDDERSEILKSFVKRNVSILDSVLFEMVRKMTRSGRPIELHTLFHMKEWSTFLQYLAHSYRQVGNHARFASQVEQILRGSLGYQKLRQEDAASANALVEAVNAYANVIQGKPLSLVDSTGFSWESVSRALAETGKSSIVASSWSPDTLFASGDRVLADAFGILFKIPEIRKELQEATGGKGPDGRFLADVVKDWVAGASLPQLARDYFMADGQSMTEALSTACRAVYGKLTLAASWGVSALQSLTAGDEVEKMSTEEQKTYRNLPSRIFYGVNSDEAIDLRLLGVPRSAAEPLVAHLKERRVPTDIRSRRGALGTMTDQQWASAMGAGAQTYKRAWRVLEGLE